MKDHRRTHNFRFLLFLVILAPLLATSTVVGFATVYLGRLSVEELTEKIVQQTVARVVSQIKQLDDVVQDQNKLNLKTMAKGPPRAGDFQRIAAALVPSFQVHDEVDSIYYAVEETGEFFSLSRNPDKGVDLLVRTTDPDGQWSRRVYNWKRRGWRFTRQLAWDHYNPRQRPFYQAAIAARTMTWTPAYEFWSKRQGDRPITGVTCATPVYDDRGHLQGVWGVDLDTLSLCDFLRTVDKEVPGYPFIVQEEADGTRRVIAHPERAMVTDAKTGMLLRNVDDIHDEVLKVFLHQIPGRFEGAPHNAVLVAGSPGLEQLTAESVAMRTKTIEFTADGTDYMGGYFVGGRNGKLLIGMVLDKNEVMGRVSQNAVLILVTFVTALTLAIIGILWLAHRASGSLVELQREAHAVGRLDLTPSAPASTRIREIRELANAMAMMKTNLRSFRKYVPADLLDDLLRNGREAMLGGERIEATIYFSDIVDFTPAAEKLTPEKVVEHLCEYLQAMSDGIASHDGTVDKFIGDAVMAFWNALRPDPGHAADACRAALANQRRLDHLNEQWSLAGKPVFRTRIGVHTGPVIIGNIGSEQRMNYTVIGDTVNLASRLEGMNKLYHTRILISETTFSAAGAAICARPVDRTGVKGKTELVTVYELLCEAGAETPELSELKLRTEKAFALYLHGDYTRAAGLYRGILERWPEDAVSAVLLQRCEELATTG